MELQTAPPDRSKNFIFRASNSWQIRLYGVFVKNSVPQGSENLKIKEKRYFFKIFFFRKIFKKKK